MHMHCQRFRAQSACSLSAQAAQEIHGCHCHLTSTTPLLHESCCKWRDDWVQIRVDAVLTVLPVDALLVEEPLGVRSGGQLHALPPELLEVVALVVRSKCGLQRAWTSNAKLQFQSAQTQNTREAGGHVEWRCRAVRVCVFRVTGLCQDQDWRLCPSKTLLL